MGIFKNRNVEEEEDITETYEYDYICDNCGYEVILDIPMGTRVIDYESTEKCENCGCAIIDIESRKNSNKEE